MYVKYRPAERNMFRYSGCLFGQDFYTFLNRQVFANSRVSTPHPTQCCV